MLIGLNQFVILFWSILVMYLFSLFTSVKLLYYIALPW